MKIFVETSTFDKLGGWLIDTQSFENIELGYLMAHGIGQPVDDAETIIHIPETATWHIYVYTRNWSKIWQRGSAAGIFQIKVNDELLPEILGNGKSTWSWQACGVKELFQGNNTFALHDLKGFNGRCAAIYLTTEPNDLPPDDSKLLKKYRLENFPKKIVDDPVFYDFIVCGGGYAGMCGALTAKYSGLKTLLIQDRSMLGGCNSSEIRVWLGGFTNLGKYPKLGTLTALLGPISGVPGDIKSKEIFEDSRKAMLFKINEDLMLNEIVIDIEKDPKNQRKIVAILTENLRTGEITRRRAELFADCTGDGVIARLCGCEYMYGRESFSEYGESLAPENSDCQVMGHSVLWEAIESKNIVDFPDIDWGIEFDDESVVRRSNSCWDWECGQYRNQVLECEHIRDYGLMSALCNWSYLKNHASDKAQWRNYELTWISPIGGKRESYRIKGDLVVTQNDLEKQKKYDDATAEISWNIDLHFPDPKNEARFGEAFLSCAYHRGIGEPFGVPYRALYARDMDNLFIGGRIISFSHVAFSCVRVMRTLGMLGEVIGLAATVCRKNSSLPRKLYPQYFSELQEKMQAGVPLRQPHAYYPDTGESFHFMRPAGAVNNSDENVWIRLVDDENAATPIPPEINDCIKKLNINCVREKMKF